MRIVNCDDCRFNGGIKNGEDCILRKCNRYKPALILADTMGCNKGDGE